MSSGRGSRPGQDGKVEIMRQCASTWGLAAWLVATPLTAIAQTPAPQQLPPPPASTTETRPATTTYMGDTGLWMVPTGEILPAGKFSISAYRVNFDDNQGFTDVSNWPITFGYGVGDRAEIFGALTVVNRVDRDIRPLFAPPVPLAGSGCVVVRRGGSAVDVDGVELSFQGSHYRQQ